MSKNSKSIGQEGTEPSGAWDQCGETGRRWEKAVWKRGFSRPDWCFSHLFPRFSGISHLFPLDFYFMTKRSKISPQRRGDAEVNAKFCGKITDFYAVFHDFPHFYAQIRAVFTRFYAFLRRGPIFRREFEFPSPPGDGCPSGVVRSAETWWRKVR